MTEGAEQLMRDLALGALEEAEVRSLSWGYVDTSLREDEAEAEISSALARSNLNADVGAILDELVDARTARVWLQDGERRYRSRFADLVRELVHSRQLFPGRPWQASPTLVSDFRIDVRPRTYPKRDISLAASQTTCEDGTAFTELQQKLWSSILSTGNKFLFARFQVEVARRLLRTPGEHGTIVTAGTGSGKTIAFYLPAMLAAVDGLTPNDFWTRVLSIYPRQELLKDQLSEAYRLASNAAQVLKQAGKRPFTFGALYGGTPNRADAAELEKKGWRKSGQAFICPTLRCPVCTSEMKWLEQDVKNNVEKLLCTRGGCSGATGPETLRLTRASLQAKPPDFLFTTSEMLNQRLSDTKMRRLFGVGVSRPKRPMFILLDEVHTYFGTSGAQTALLLRRWRFLLNSAVRWVGLSATLREAPRFFADLTGLRPDIVAEISPQPEDLVSEGADYQLLLRSDPASQAATLSTSIQAAMLIARMLDPTSNQPSNGRFGRRLFAFTDDLDVTHRLFDNLRDAEAYDRFGKADLTRLPLAALRASAAPDPIGREANGQRWELAETLRGTLDSRLIIGRTTSRDPGVDGRADVIVATAALEVGFNDPDVGAILQHKAPRSFASFLQRRGRAGRRRGMRPLTVTVLSDYGRDRLTFQSYEHLFDPVLDRQSLPIRNGYVLRMQAVFALFDWMTHRIAADGESGWAWDTLAGPARNSYDAGFRKHAKSLLQKLVQLDNATLDDLRRHLLGALYVDDSTLDAILWESPRALILEAIPTLTRRLFRDWNLASPSGGQDLTVPFHPLPDFVPRTLFSELNLPEVRVEVPAARVGGDAEHEPMPVLQALTQFAPGRVRRRFADEYGGLAHWFPLDPNVPLADLPISVYSARNEYVGDFSAVVEGVKRNVPVYRPWQIKVEKVAPNTILHSSNGAWIWQSDFEFLGEVFAVELPTRSAWSKILPKLEFRLHRFAAGVAVRRFAVEGYADLRRSQSNSFVRFRLCDDEKQAAGVGFAFEADAMVIPLHLPSAIELAAQIISPTLLQSLRALRFRDALTRDKSLPADINAFQRDWLQQIFLLAAIQRAETTNKSLNDVVIAIGTEQNPQAFESATVALVTGTLIDDDDHGGGITLSKLETTLIDTLRQPGVIARIAQIAHETLFENGGSWGAWLFGLLKTTLADAILQACLIAAPSNTAIEGLNVDIKDIDGVPTVLVTETTLGGGGTIEALTQAFAAEPHAFFRALEAALASSDLETAADGMSRIIQLSIKDADTSAALAKLRAAARQDNRANAQKSLFQVLSAKGIPVTHTLSVSMATRLLRPGRTAESDQVVADLLNYWRATEAKHGIELTVRLAAALAASENQLRLRLAAFGGDGNEVATADLLLWPKGGELRQRALQSYNPFQTQSPSDPALVSAVLLDDRIPLISTLESNWRQLLADALAKHGLVRLTVAVGEETQLRAIIVGLMDKPIDVGFFQFFPTVEALHRMADGRTRVEISLREWA